MDLLYIERYVPNGSGCTPKATEPLCVECVGVFPAAIRQGSVCDGVKYSITRIDTFEGYKQDITLYCKRQ